MSVSNPAILASSITRPLRGPGLFLGLFLAPVISPGTRTRSLPDSAGARQVRASLRQKSAVSGGLLRIAKSPERDAWGREIFLLISSFGLVSGGGGIRTLEAPKRRLTVFETAAFNLTLPPLRGSRNKATGTNAGSESPVRAVRRCGSEPRFEAGTGLLKGAHRSLRPTADEFHAILSTTPIPRSEVAVQARTALNRDFGARPRGGGWQTP